MKNDKATFEALLKLHKEDPTVLISNGFLERVIDNTALLATLDDEQQAFFDRSLKQSERDTELAIGAAEEGNTALIQAEERAAELEKAKASLEKESNASNFARIEAEKAKAEADEQRGKAELLTIEMQRRNSDLMAEIENTAQYQLSSDRQRYQFKSAQANAYPAWFFMFSLLAATGFLSWADKNVEAFGTILSMAVGTMLGSIATSYSSLFSNTLREDRPDKKGNGNGEQGKNQESTTPER